jgi:hypothetical protein
MTRFDLALVVTLSSLALFVGLQARETSVIAHEREGFGDAATLTNGVEAAKRESSVRRIAPTLRSTRNTRSALGPDDVLRQVRERGQGTFIHDVIVAHDSALARWPDRLVNPLRVWVQNGGSVDNWSEERNAIVRRAFTDWSETGLPIAFNFTFDSASADVRVTWTHHFNESISGKTLWAHNDRWWIVDASIQLAVHHRDGTALDLDATRAIALHEVGHLIGLDHTGVPAVLAAPRAAGILAPARRLALGRGRR